MMEVFVWWGDRPFGEIVCPRYGTEFRPNVHLLDTPHHVGGGHGTPGVVAVPAESVRVREFSIGSLNHNSDNFRVTSWNC